jgi:hypothetical protein
MEAHDRWISQTHGKWMVVPEHCSAPFDMKTLKVLEEKL